MDTIRKGYRIFDFGRDAAWKASGNYAAEVKILADKGYERVKVAPVKVGDKVYEMYEWVKKK